MKNTGHISIKGNDIDYGFRLYYIKESSGMFSWNIPAFNLFFSSKTMDEGIKKSTLMTESFFRYWLGQEGYRAFMPHLN